MLRAVARKWVWLDTGRPGKGLELEGRSTGRRKSQLHPRRFLCLP